MCVNEDGPYFWFGYKVDLRVVIAARRQPAGADVLDAIRRHREQHGTDADTDTDTDTNDDDAMSMRVADGSAFIRVMERIEGMTRQLKGIITESKKNDADAGIGSESSTKSSVVVGGGSSGGGGGLADSLGIDEDDASTYAHAQFFPASRVSLDDNDSRSSNETSAEAGLETERALLVAEGVARGRAVSSIHTQRVTSLSTRGLDR